MVTPGSLAAVDLTDLDNFADGFSHDLFGLHRRAAPVFWHEPTVNTPDDEGFWSVATYPETLQVLRDPVTYSSVSGGGRAFGGTLLQDLSIAGAVLNMMDDPRHALIRRLVSSGLTPRMIGRVEDDLRARSRRLLDGVVPGEAFDFVADVAAELPMQMICILLGVPESQRHWLFDTIEPSFDFGASRKASITELSVDEAGSRIYAYGQELIAAKRAEPVDDLLSVVVNATVDDPAAPSLSDTELYLFFNLLFSAGAELAGCRIAAGQKVLAWEGSANRDAIAFEQPDRFDVTRKPNPHLGFGQGIHYCLGANLARLELRVLFEELLSRFSTVSVVEPVEWTRSNRHTGIRHLMVELD
jgi:cytochrome P450